MFDQAFSSRIHISLGLPSLDQQRRSSVWSIFLQDLAAKGAINDSRLKTLTAAVDEKWSKEKLNGRQIRNAVRTALVVAEKKGEMVGEKEFETVLKIGREFEGYVSLVLASHTCHRFFANIGTDGCAWKGGSDSGWVSGSVIMLFDSYEHAMINREKGRWKTDSLVMMMDRYDGMPAMNALIQHDFDEFPE